MSRPRRLIAVRTGRRFMMWLFLGILLTGPTGARADDIVRDIPSGIIYLSDEEGPAHALVVDKSRQEITLYQYDGQFRRLWQGACSTGHEDGEKQAAGDGRTPEGVFFFTQAYEARYLAPLYGTRAFVTDYPNLMDRLAGRDGSAIWLHGTNKPLAARSSNGCVAMVNADIDRLADYIDLNRTPILIAERIDFAPIHVQERQANKIIDFLDRWQDTVITGTYHRYLSFYHSRYLPPIKWWTDWSATREAAAAAGRPLRLVRGRTEVFVHDGIYLALMDLTVSDGTRSAPAGRRKLYLVPRNRSFRIVGDAVQGREHGGQDQADSPLVAGARSLGAIRDAATEVAAVVEQWRAAWSGKDQAGYGACYAADFRFNDMDRAAWLEKKQRLARQYRFISVRLSDLRISVAGRVATATFQQEYRSDAFRVAGTKTLELIMEDGQWKIRRETFQRR